MQVYFLDNDIILKLAAYNLFWQMADCLKIKQEYFRVLPTASSYVSGNSRRIQQYKEDSIQRAKHIANGCQHIQSPSSSLEYQLLLGIEGIDPGEARIVSATQEEQDFYLLTGDKRLIRALAASNLLSIKQRLYKKIICLEQLMLYVTANSDFDKVRRRVMNAESCDQVISDAFSLSKQSNKETVLQVLNQAVEELRYQTGDLLVEYLSCLLPKP